MRHHDKYETSAYCACTRLLSIHQANCGQAQTALRCQLKRFSSRPTSSPSVSVCCAQWSVYQSIHLPPVLPTITRQPTPLLDSFVRYLPSCICLTFLLSGQWVGPGGTVKTWMHLDIAGVRPCVLALWHQKGQRSRLSAHDRWGCLHRAR